MPADIVQKNGVLIYNQFRICVWCTKTFVLNEVKKKREKNSRISFVEINSIGVSAWVISPNQNFSSFLSFWYLKKVNVTKPELVNWF